MLEAYKKRTIQEAYNCELDFAAGAAWADSHPIKHKERTERYCKHFSHANGAYWCDKGVFPMDCKNCDKADWIE